MAFGSPKKPKTTDPASTDRATEGAQSAQEAALEARRRAAAQKGRQSTVVASGRLGNIG